MNAKTRLLALFVLCLISVETVNGAVRIKDITDVEGVRSNQLYGLGLVIGLNGTGARQQSLATRQLAIDMLRKMDTTTKIARQNLQDNVFTSNSISAVMVTTELTAFARPGSRLDVVVSVLDTASSLRGGTLLLAPLKGVDGEVYAVAQGPISLGGVNLQQIPQFGALRNHPTTGRIANGAIVERSALGTISENGRVRLLLRSPDFATAENIAERINQSAASLIGISNVTRIDRRTGRIQLASAQVPQPTNTATLRAKATKQIARTLDAGTIEIRVPPNRSDNVVKLISEIGRLEVEPDHPARVVINERTGTVIVGRDVRITAVAIAHGNLVIKPVEPEPPPQPGPAARALLGIDPAARQPQRFGVNPSALFGGTPEGDKLNVIEKTYTVADLARALNTLGVTPRDLIAIFQALKESGALHAELLIM